MFFIKDAVIRGYIKIKDITGAIKINAYQVMIIINHETITILA